MNPALVLAMTLWSAPVEVPPGPQPWLAAPVPGWMESLEGHRLRQVRLLDSLGQEIPYRVLEPAAETDVWFSADVRNRREIPGGYALELVNSTGELVDRLRLGLRGQEGVLEATVEAFGLDGGPGIVVQRMRLGRLGSAEQQELPLAPTDAPRLVVTTSTILAGLELSWVELRRVTRWQLHADIAEVGLRAQEGSGPEGEDVFILAQEGPAERLSALHLEIGAPTVFSRRAQVEGVQHGDGEWRPIGLTTVARLPLADGRPGITHLDIPIQRGAWSRLRVRAPRSGEAPLVVTGARATVARRWIIFPRPEAPGGLTVTRSTSVRSWSLEETARTVDPAAAGQARIGSRRATAPTPAAPQCTPGRSRLVNALFIGAAILLALLAWRVLAPRSR